MMKIAVLQCLAGFVVLLFASHHGQAQLRTENVSPMPESTFDSFITREGDKLMEGDQEFRFAGANMPGLSLPYDYTLQFPERLILPTPWEQEDALKTLVQMNARVVRLWNLPIRGPKDDWMDWAYVQKPGVFNEEAFKTLDHLLALANRYGIRIIFSLCAEAGDYLGGVGEYAAWRGKDRSSFYADSLCKADYKATLRYVVNRRNSVTGLRYRDDKAILAWQLGNEMREAPLAWEGEMATYLKSLDANHLVMAGNDLKIPEEPPADLDILVRHYYKLNMAKNCQEDKALAEGKRPLVVGEYGLTSEVDSLRAFYEEALENGTSGHLIWSLYFHHRFGGFYWHQIFTHPSIGSFHWPGFESGTAHNERQILKQLREYAFKMRGQEGEDMPIPDSPYILPMTDSLPFLTWRGSAGAHGYLIERSETPEGPWTVVAEDVSDASVAYRPLFADESADMRQAYYYRISAQNSTGRSAPSPLLGPVSFVSKLFVDELHELGERQHKSVDVTINNDYNGLYGEYLYRAKGDSSSRLVYQIPGQAENVKLWAFFEDRIKPPSVRVSTTGNAFSEAVVVERNRREFSSLDKVKQLRGMKRTLIEYYIKPAPTTRFVQVRWNTTMELDRVEIEYQ